MVEHGVGYLQTWILGKLRHRYFFSMTDLNQEIQSILQELNNKPYQKREGTRQSVFQKIDRPAMGLLQLSKKYGSERLESACVRAAELGGFQYTTVKNILKNDQDQRPILTGTDNLPLPEHKNIRGSEYYK